MRRALWTCLALVIGGTWAFTAWPRREAIRNPLDPIGTVRVRGTPEQAHTRRIPGVYSESHAAALTVAKLYGLVPASGEATPLLRDHLGTPIKDLDDVSDVLSRLGAIVTTWDDLRVDELAVLVDSDVPVILQTSSTRSIVVMRHEADAAGERWLVSDPREDAPEEFDTAKLKRKGRAKMRGVVAAVEVEPATVAALCRVSKKEGTKRDWCT